MFRAALQLSLNNELNKIIHQKTTYTCKCPEEKDEFTNNIEISKQKEKKDPS